MMVETLLTDNPLITKHLRSRLRRRDVLAPAALAVIVTLGIYLQEPKGRIYALVFVQALVLQLLGTYQVESAVNKARMSRLLDFHRFSPLSPLTTTLGYLLGAPVREWIIAAAIVPFEISLLPSSDLSPVGFITILGSMVLCTLLYHLMAMAVALLSTGTRATSGGAIVALCAQFFWAVPPLSYITMAPAFRFAVGDAPALPHLGSPAPAEALALATLHQIVFVLFLLVGVVRKMRREDAHFTSKPGGLLFFATFCALAASDLPRLQGMASIAAVAYIYPVSMIAVGIIASVTPSGREFAASVRRAKRAGLARLPLWTDAAPTWVVIAGIAVITLAATFAVNSMSAAMGSKPLGQMPAPPVAVNLVPAALIAVASLVTFGCTRLAFELQYDQKYAKAYNLFLIVLYWLAPIMVSAFLGFSVHLPESLMLVTGFSPWIGVALAASGQSQTGLLVGVHMCIAAYATWWCWSVEKNALQAAKTESR